MGFNEDLAAAKQMQAGSALQLQAFGRIWRVYIGLAPDSGGPHRQQVIDAVNAVLDTLGLRVGRGWQAYDPVVRSGRPSTYATLCEKFATQADGGRQDAESLYRWALGEIDAAQLSPNARDLGVVVMFAEVGRGFSGSLPELFNHWGSIIKATSPGVAAQLWRMVPKSWIPATTYRDDVSASGLYGQ